MEYANELKLPFRRYLILMQGSYGIAYTNGIKECLALLKRGYNGVFYHISSKHLFRYINGFALRLDKYDVKVRTLDRIDGLIDGALVID